MIVQNGEVLCDYSNGSSDLPNEISNTTETRFSTASAGKVFVAVGILQLIEAGKLALESKIGELLDFDLHDIDQEVTVRQLLNHTSGVPDYFDESEMDENEELWVDFPNYKIRSTIKGTIKGMYIIDIDLDELTASELESFISDTPPDEKEVVIKFLKSFEVSAHTSQPVFDFLTGVEVFDADNARTDGVYTWYESEIYHFEKYNLKISKEFIDYVLAKE